jgi:ribonuclease III
MDFREFETIAGVVFADKQLLRTAFTHRSYINENKHTNLEHNERLEFLGDAVLELIVTDFLFRKYPDRAEGDLTAYRSALVNAITLSSVAASLRMNDFLLLSKGEAKDIGRARQYILANTFEAVVGAIYLDQGYAAAERFISANVFHLVDDIVEKRLWQDAKSRFQEKAQEKVGITPAYRTLKEEGPDHNRVFTIGLYLNDDFVTEGRGKSKQEGEQEAARKALEKKGWG